jgi:hypothetical protein
MVWQYGEGSKTVDYMIEILAAHILFKGLATDAIETLEEAFHPTGAPDSSGARDSTAS